MEVDNGGFETPEREPYDSSSNSTPHEHRSFAEFAKDKLDSAGRSLRRRLPAAGPLGQLLAPRRLLLHSAPTHHTDVVITFSKGVEDSSLLWVLQKLRASRLRLRVTVRHHKHAPAHAPTAAFYITADDHVLLQTAEEVHLPKLLKPEYGGGYKEFSVRDMHCFLKGSSASDLLNSMERGALVKYALEAVRAAPGDEDALLPALALRVGQAIVPACLSRGVIASMFPLHERPALDALRRRWVSSFFTHQPLDDICEYFGVKIAMYFAWLGHYTQSLAVPALVGIIFWIWIGTADEYWKHIAHLLFSLFNVLWACVYLETWKRYSNVLAYRWGTLDQRDDLLAEPRPLFQGAMGVSPVTGRPEPVYPAWRRRAWRHLVSLPAIGVCLALAAAATTAMLRAQDWWESHLVYLSWIPRAFLAVVIALEEEAYSRFARWLNDKENYRLETKYENHLIVKIALFQFVNSFMSLFYIAFYLQDMDKLKEQLAVLLITRQIIGNLKESALPYLIENLRLARICGDVFGALSPSKEPTASQLLEQLDQQGESGGGQESAGDEGGAISSGGAHALHQAEVEAQLFKYEGTFAEYLEMLTQLGLVMLFSSAFPLAAACALISNACEVRADAFKLCHVAQRPFGERVRNIGSWQHAMEAMVALAVCVNCALMGVSGGAQRLLPHAAHHHAVIAVVALEHVILVSVVALRMAIPSIPEWLATEMAKCEYRRREASNTLTAPLVSSCSSQEEVPTPTPLAAAPAAPPPQSPAATPAADKKKISIGKIPEIPPFRPKVASSAEAKEREVSSGSLPRLPDVSPTKGALRKEGVVGGVAPLSLLGVRGLRDEPLHRSAHCLPHASAATPHHRPLANPTLQEVCQGGVGGGSQPELSAAESTSAAAATTASDDDRHKDKLQGRSRAKALLVKRVRSVAVFSLGLRKAREAAAQQDRNNAAASHSPRTPDKSAHLSNLGLPAPSFGGELSHIPIEQLIQVDDVKRQTK